MSREAMKCLPGARDGLVKKYIDKQGQPRRVGISEKLKASQCLDSLYLQNFIMVLSLDLLIEFVCLW